MKTRFYQHQDLIELKIVNQNFHNLHQDPVAVLKKQARFSELNLLQQTHLQHIQMQLNWHGSHMQSHLQSSQVIQKMTLC